MKDIDQHNIEQNAPNLFKIKREHNLEVPKGYFNQLPKELLKIIDEKEKVVSINKKWAYIVSIAAAIIIGIFIIPPNKTIKNTEVIAYNNNFNNLTAEDFETLLLFEEEDHLADVIDFGDTEELLFLARELQKPLLSVEVTEQDFENYFESEIEDYY
jgi:hypothetical protein